MAVAESEALTRGGSLGGAPRRKVRVPLLAAGVALVLLAGLLVLWGFSRVSDRTEVLMVTEPVAAGEPIPESVLATTFVAVDDGAGRFYRAGTDLSDVVAATDLAAGDVLTPSLVAAEPTVPDGWMELGALVKVGRFPATITVGDGIRAVPTEGDGDVEATVVELIIGEDGALSVVLATPAPDAGRVAQWAAGDELTLVRSP